MAKDGKKIAIGAGLLAAVTGVVLLVKKKPIPPEDIVLSDLQIEPSEVYVGETVSISVVATNIGGEVGSYEVSLEVL